MEKIKVNLSYHTYSTIINDAQTFNIVKSNGDINKNEMFNRIVANLAKHNLIEQIETKNKYYEILSAYVDNKKNIEAIINEIQMICQKDSLKKNEIYDQIVMIRPTKIYEEIFNEILYNYLDNSSISSYFRNLFDYYASLDQDSREKIIFKNQFEKIQQAIKNGLTIKMDFSLNMDSFHVYKIVQTKEKLFNYVLGVIKSPSGKRKTVSIHLYKFLNVIILNKNSDFSNNEIKMLDNMIEVGPQYIAGEFLDAKIKLTNLGKRKFRTIFLNRPKTYKIEDSYYYFKASRTQLFQYFSRFGKDAYVIYPEILKQDLIKYYKDGYESLIEDIE